jgi:crossover junction endodeoxyribonuclease RusA
MRLPWPPSVNTLWRNVVIGRSARTLLSKKGRAFFEHAAAEVDGQREGRKIAGRAAVEIVLHPPDRRLIDIDNRAKALLDSVVKGGLLEDDNQVDVLIVLRSSVTPGGTAIVRISEIDP